MKFHSDPRIRIAPRNRASAFRGFKLETIKRSLALQDGESYYGFQMSAEFYALGHAFFLPKMGERGYRYSPDSSENLYQGMPLARRELLK